MWYNNGDLIEDDNAKYDEWLKRILDILKQETTA
jgi:hypothetical protein